MFIRDKERIGDNTYETYIENIHWRKKFGNNYKLYFVSVFSKYQTW